jgi:hypothetical protein
MLDKLEVTPSRDANGRLTAGQHDAGLRPTGPAPIAWLLEVNLGRSGVVLAWPRPVLATLARDCTGE